MASNLPNRLQAKEFYRDILRDAEAAGNVRSVMNVLGRRDLFFLLTQLLHRRDIDRDWLFDRCQEVQDSPDGMLDLWAREHYKSTIITFGKTIQDILDSHSEDSFRWDKEITVGIFSHTRPIAKAFLAQIMVEFETNELLKQIYPDVLWAQPRREAQKWSLDNGIVVKRKSNPKEATVEAWGLVDGQPTSKHFDILVDDDVVTRESITTPDQIKKTTEAWALHLNLGASGGKRRTIGTRYHFNDSYREMLKRGSVIARIHAGTVDGTPTGAPVFLSQEALAEKRRDLGPYVFACQILQDPKAEDAMGFHPDWVKHFDAAPYQRGEKPWPQEWNYYLICDPAGEKKKENDYTVMAVIGLGPDNNYYLVDGIRDRLNLKERTAKLFSLTRKYHLAGDVGYEKYGKDSDIEHILEKMEDSNWRFGIKALGGGQPKNDRIRKLVPVFSEGRFFLPYELHFIDHEGKSQDFITQLINDEYLPFPVGVHDDMIDCISRIRDPAFGAVFPDPPLVVPVTARTYQPLEYR